MPAAKQAPETLELRAKPRPVTRLNKKALMVAAGGAVLIIFGAMSVAARKQQSFIMSISNRQQKASINCLNLMRM